MKRLLFVFFIVISGYSYSQDFICDKIPSKNGRVHYEGVVMIDSVPSSTLYNNAKLWIGKTFVSSKSVIQSEIPNSLIILKARMDIGNTDNSGVYTFTLTLQFKDGRYRYELSDIGIDLYIARLNYRKTSPIEETPLLKDCSDAPLILFDSKIKSLITDFDHGIKANNNDW